ncbi:MAG TPA: response regulator [Bryobacteraceae bacterium]|nr:response regulator [Bryobacteraceae bacterium]
MKARILIVEDESIVQLDLQRRLQRMGHSVVGMASKGEDAIAKAIELKPDLVIMDVRLEGSMDGLEAARRIQAEQRTPVVYVTAYASTIEQALTPDILGPCVSKPFRTTELQSAIDRTLAGIGNNAHTLHEGESRTCCVGDDGLLRVKPMPVAQPAPPA